MKRRVFYLLLTLSGLILCGVIVKLFSDNYLVRGLMGDFVFVMLMYCGVKCFADLKPLTVAGFTLGTAYVTEFLQYVNLYQYIGMGDNRLARLIFGATFDMSDLLAYTMGVICIYLLDTRVLTRRFKQY